MIGFKPGGFEGRKIEVQEDIPKASLLEKVLPDGFLNEYLDKEHLYEFEEMLSGIERWQDENSEHYTEKENVLVHTARMLEIVNLLEKNYPKLADVIDIKRLRLMMVMHDMGESLRGDRPYTVDAVATPEERARAKLFERLWGVRILKKVRESKKDELIEIYKAQGSRVENDIEAWMNRFIDVAQAEQFGAKTGLFKIRAEQGALGYKETGNTPKPEYYWTLMNGVENALRVNNVDGDVLREWQELIKDTMLSDKALAEHYPTEDITGLREQFSTE